MLSDSEQTAALESIERVRQSVVNHLSSNRGVSAAVNFVANLHRAVDKVVQQASDHDPKPECKAGCAYCCSVRVEATEPEIFRIVREVKMRPAAQVDSLLERLGRRAAAAESGVTGSRIDCAFLENNLCSIYEVRPAVCRKAHSLSVKCCEELAPEIPQNLELALGAEVLMMGTSDGYREVRLCTSAHELCNAVLMALTEETTEARWYNGESVFPNDHSSSHG